MHKTVLAVIVGFFGAFTATAQRTDSLLRTTKPATGIKDSTLPSPFYIHTIPANFYASHLPFFCDKELKLQKAIKMSVKFRLGSVEQCNKLEWKP
jgi:hypothetical protein